MTTRGLYGPGHGDDPRAIYDQRDADHATEQQEIEAVLAELHAAGLELVPHIGYIDAKVCIRWDDAMGAAERVLATATTTNQKGPDA